MTGSARGRIRIGKSVNALGKFFYFSRVTLGAFSRLEFGRRTYFVDVAMTGSASPIAKHRVNVFCRLLGLIRVTGRTRNFGNLRGMREILDRSMTVLAAEDSVYARGVFFRADGNVRALFRFHARLAVTSEAGFILFQRLRRFFLSASKRGNAETR